MTAAAQFAAAQALSAVPGSRILTAWRAERERARAPQASAVSWNSQDFASWVNGGLTSAGVPVNERTAMSVSAVYACVSLIGGAIASLPLHIYRRDASGQRERVDLPLWWLLNEQPHISWAAAPWWEFAAWSLLLHGDSFSEIVRAGSRSPDVAGFLPWHPRTVQVDRVEGRLKYSLFDNGAAIRVVDQDDMLHVPGVGFDGFRGISQLRHALRNPAGIALAADEFSAAFFKNGARPDFALVTAGTLSDAAAKTLRDTWQQRYGGAANAHLPAILTGGLEVKELTMPAEDAQLIATRQFQVEDIARIFGVPPFMIGHTEKTTSWGAGIEQLSIGFVKYTLQRHLTKFEQEINRKLWPTRSTYFAEFSVDGLLRGDAKTRSEYYRAALGGSNGPGWMTQDEVRRLENQLPRGGGADQLTQWSAGNAQPTQAAG